MPLKPLSLALAGGAVLSLPLPAQAQEVSLTAGRELAAPRCSRRRAMERTGDSPNRRAPRFGTWAPASRSSTRARRVAAIAERASPAQRSSLVDSTIEEVVRSTPARAPMRSITASMASTSAVPATAIMS